MKVNKIAILGFGNSAKAFAKMLIEKKEEIAKEYDAEISVIAISTGSHGVMVDEEGVNLAETLKLAEAGKSIGDSALASIEIAEKSDYDILIELTPLNIKTGEPAASHIKAALKRGKIAITANKGPIAWHCEEIMQLEKDALNKETLNSVEKWQANGKQKFYFETTVMDGAPIFNLYKHTLKMCKVTRIEGILNSTTNYVLEELALGKEYDAIIEEGQRRGFIEADPALDIEGYDAAAKITALANILMKANKHPIDVDRTGVEKITPEDLIAADSRGNTIKLICKAEYVAQKGSGDLSKENLQLSVKPVEIPKSHIYATITGTTSVVTIGTDLMRDLTIIEHDPEIEQTAYGVFGDLLEAIS
ncbi:MAG: hypothetical protein ACRCUS_02830 [Anaerovoracaceae bacterium]